MLSFFRLFTLLFTSNLSAHHVVNAKDDGLAIMGNRAAFLTSPSSSSRKARIQIGTTGGNPKNAIPIHSQRIVPLTGRRGKFSVGQLLASRSQDQNEMLFHAEEDETSFPTEEREPANDDGDDNDTPALYNAVPLFTGTVVLLFNVAITGYFAYVGMTGVDPLTGELMPRAAAGL